MATIAGEGAQRVLDELRVKLLELYGTVLQGRYWTMFTDIRFGKQVRSTIGKVKEIFTSAKAKLTDHGMHRDQIEDQLTKICEESEEVFTKTRMNMFLTNRGRSVGDLVAICKTSYCVDACLQSAETATGLSIRSSEESGQIVDENMFIMDHKKVIFNTLASDLQKQKGVDSKEFAEDFVFILRKYIDMFGHTDEVLSMVSEIIVDLSHVAFSRSVVLEVAQLIRVNDLEEDLGKRAHADVTFRHRICKEMIAHPDLEEVSYLRLILHQMAFDSRSAIIECRRDSSVMYACGLVDSIGSDVIDELGIDFAAFAYPRNHHVCIVKMCDLCVSLTYRKRPNKLCLVLPIEILMRVQKMICPCSAQEFLSEQNLLEGSD